MFKTMRSPIIGICLCVLTVVIWLLFKPLVQVGGGIYYAFASRNADQWVLVLSEQLSNDMNFSQWNSLDQGEGRIEGKLVLPADLKHAQLGVSILLNNRMRTDIARVNESGSFDVSLPYGTYRMDGLQIYELRDRFSRALPLLALDGKEMESFYTCRDIVVSNQVAVLAPRTLSLYEN
jgi:hypothetical protein